MVKRNRFWKLQLIASVFAGAACFLLGIFPAPLFAGIGIAMAALLFYTGRRRRRTRGRKRPRSRAAASLLIAVLLIAAGFYALRVNCALDQISVGEESDEETQTFAVTDEPFNVYISGIDVYGDISQKSRSDVNLIATVNPDTHKILLTTTPRDYYVYIPDVSGDQRDKLTHAGNYGVDASVATLENLYDTDIPFYIRVNFTSVEEIVDRMGGVDVESDVSFTTSKAAGEIVEIEEGVNHLNGKEALAFVRERKAFVSGDNQRGKNQQALFRALVKKVESPLIVLRANGIISSVAGNAETNLSEAQIKALIRMQLSDGKSWEIESVAAEGDDSEKRYCYSYPDAPLYVTVPDETSVEEIRLKMKEIQTGN